MKNTEKIKVLYMYTEVMGYNVSFLDKLVSRGGIEVLVIHWDYKKNTAYNPPAIDGIVFVKRSSLTRSSLLNLAITFNPDLTYVSGWQDLAYLETAKKIKSKQNPVVCGFDSQWIGTFRQKVGSILVEYLIKPLCFSHAWVAGPYQYEYALKMGFKKHEVIFDLLACDEGLFYNSQEFLANRKMAVYPKRFLYVGRLENEKGISNLIRAWSLFYLRNADWTLRIVGSGTHGNDVRYIPGVEFKNFVHPKLLPDEFSNSGCFILPSTFEPWGVVVHEAASTGLPLLLSDVVGSSPVFLKNGYNGYSFLSNDYMSLYGAMSKIASLDVESLIKMSIRSLELSGRISTEASIASLLSIRVNG